MVGPSFRGEMSGCRGPLKHEGCIDLLRPEDPEEVKKQQFEPGGTGPILGGFLRGLEARVIWNSVVVYEL